MRLSPMAITLAPKLDEPAAVAAHGVVASPEPSPLAPELQASFPTKLVVCVFVALYVVGTIRLLFNLWLGNGGDVTWLLGMPGAALEKNVVPIVHTVLGAILGAGVLDLVSFHHYVAIRNNFQARHCWGYFFAPILAAALGIMTYALLRTGLLVFAGGGGD